MPIACRGVFFTVEIDVIPVTFVCFNLGSKPLHIYSGRLYREIIVINRRYRLIDHWLCVNGSG